MVRGKSYSCFLKKVEIRDLYEAELLAVLEELQIYSGCNQERLAVDSNSSNAVRWVSQEGSRLWKLQYYFNEIKHLSSRLWVSFRHEVRSANSIADALAK